MVLPSTCSSGTVNLLVSAMRLLYPFTAPAESPCTTYRCSRAISTTDGSTQKLEGTETGAQAKLTLRDWFTSSLFTDIQKQLGLQLVADIACRLARERKDLLL